MRKRAAAGEGTPRLLAAGVALATAVSFARVIAIVAALKPELLKLIAPRARGRHPRRAGLRLHLGLLARQRRRGRTRASNSRIRSASGRCIGFAILLAAIVLVGRALGENLGATGAIVGALALGLADVDAVTVSMSRLTPQPLSLQSAALAILAAVVSNNLSKIAIGAVVGRGAFAVEIAAMAALCFAARCWLAYWADVLLQRLWSPPESELTFLLQRRKVRQD